MSGSGISNDPCLVTNWTQLDAVRLNLTASYSLTANLFSSSPGYAGIGDNFIPIGNATAGYSFNGSFNGNDKAYSMILKANNNILIAGGGYLTTVKYDFTLIELNADGTAGTWSSKADFDSNLDDIAYGLAEDNNGKFVLAGSSGNTTSKKTT